MNWDQVIQLGQIAIMIIIAAATFALAMFLIFSILYMPSFLQKKVNLKQAEEIMQHNLEIVEKATFFETSTEFNELINKQMEDIRANSAKLKSLRAEYDQVSRDLQNKKGT